MITQREYLEKSLANLKWWGWCKGQARNDLGKVCMQGAMYYTLLACQREHNMTGKECERFYANAQFHLQRKVRETGHPSVSAFNDFHETTFEDVVTMFEKAIADCA